MHKRFPLLAVAAILLPLSLAHADPYTLGNLKTFAVYGFGSGFTYTTSPAPGYVYGNIGIGTGGDLNLPQNGSYIGGKVYYAGAVTAGMPPTGNFYVNGTVTINGVSCTGTAACMAQTVANSAEAAGASTDAVTMYAAIATLPPTGTITNFGQSVATYGTVNGVANTNVYYLSSATINRAVTLQGDASDFFIFNIYGGFSGSSGGNIILSGGITADHVVFNMLCATTITGVCTAVTGATATDVSMSGSFSGSGIIMGLDRNFSIDNGSGMWTGRFISDDGKTINIWSHGHLRQPEVPEPGTLLLFGTGLTGLGGFLTRRRRYRAA